MTAFSGNGQVPATEIPVLQHRALCGPCRRVPGESVSARAQALFGKVLTMRKKCRKPAKSMPSAPASAIESMTSCAAAVSCAPAGSSVLITVCTSARLSTPSPFVSRCLLRDVSFCQHTLRMLESPCTWNCCRRGQRLPILRCSPGAGRQGRISGRLHSVCFEVAGHRTAAGGERPAAPEQLDGCGLGALRRADIAWQLQIGRYCGRPRLQLVLLPVEEYQTEI